VLWQIVLEHKKITGTAVAQWLGYCATDPSDRIMALGSTQPLTEMSTSSIS
jgi:hypothetical protein